MDLNLRLTLYYYLSVAFFTFNRLLISVASNLRKMTEGCFDKVYFEKKRKKEKTPDKKLSRMQRVKLTFMDQCKRFRLTGDKWQSKTLFLANFDPRSSIVQSVFDGRLTGVLLKIPMSALTF